MKPLGVILAGGRSRRLGGGDKALLEIAGLSLLEHVAARLSPQVAAMVLNANGDPARFARFGLPVIPDGITGHAGPLAGVLAGMDHAAELGFSQIVTVAADTPFFPADLVLRLQAADAPLAMAATGGGADDRHPTFALWPVSLRENLRAALLAGQRKVVTWADAQGCVSVRFASGQGDPFFNINTPDDLAHARQMITATGR